MQHDKAVTAEKLLKKFGNFRAVDEITFEVNRGEIFGFLGANGAGKTTAIKMLIGLLKPSGGKALVAGYDVFTQAEKVKSRIGYMSQKFSLYEDMTVAQNIRLYGGIYGLSKNQIEEKIQWMSKRLGLERKALIASLPLGWKQKLAFSVAMVHDPEIIFLDEPTGGVDPITRRQFWEMIYEAAEAGKTLFVTTHYMDEAEYCDRVSIMAEGKIAALGKPAELKRIFKAKDMDEVFVGIAREGKTMAV